MTPEQKCHIYPFTSLSQMSSVLSHFSQHLIFQFYKFQHVGTICLFSRKKGKKGQKKGQRRPVVVVVVVVMYTHRIEASEVSELQTCSCNISSCMEFLLHRLIHRSSKREHVAAHVASPSSPFEWISTLPSCSATQYFSSQSSALLTKAATSRVNKLFLFKCNKFLTKICKIFYTVKNFGRQVTLIQT